MGGLMSPTDPDPDRTTGCAHQRADCCAGLVGGLWPGGVSVGVRQVARWVDLYGPSVDVASGLPGLWFGVVGWVGAHQRADRLAGLVGGLRLGGLVRRCAVGTAGGLPGLWFGVVGWVGAHQRADCCAGLVGGLWPGGVSVGVRQVALGCWWPWWAARCVRRCAAGGLLGGPLRAVCGCGQWSAGLVVWGCRLGGCTPAG